MIEKIVDGVKVFVRTKIYGKQSDFEIYPQCLQTAGERIDIEHRKKTVSFMPENFLDEIMHDDFIAPGPGTPDYK